MVGKLLLIMVLALAAALYFPQTRPMVVERAMPLLNPAFRWATNGEMEQIVRDLIGYEQTYLQFPSERGEFATWMSKRYQVESSTLDSWGNAYELRSSRASFTVVSAGPDGEFGTDDDLQRSAERPRIPSRR